MQGSLSSQDAIVVGTYHDAANTFSQATLDRDFLSAHHRESDMVNVDSYLRIYRWRGLTGKLLVEGEPDPHQTAIALIQLAALIRIPSCVNDLLPKPLSRVLMEQVDERGATYGDMTDPLARSLFLSDLYDFLLLLKSIGANKKATDKSCLTDE